MIQSTGMEEITVDPGSSKDDPYAEGAMQSEDAPRSKEALGFRAARRLSNFHSVTALLDALIKVHNPIARAFLSRLRKRNPDASPGETLEALNGYLKAAVTAGGMGAAAGLTAPGLAKAGALVLGVGQVLTTAEATALYTSTRAALHGVEAKEIQRGLLLAGLLRKESVEETVSVPEAKLRHLVPILMTAVPAAELSRGARSSIKALTGRGLGSRVPKRLSRGVPFIAGAVVGGRVSADAADQILERMDALFGPPPSAWPTDYV